MSVPVVSASAFPRKPADSCGECGSEHEPANGRTNASGGTFAAVPYRQAGTDPYQGDAGPDYADAKVKQPTEACHIERCHSGDPKFSMTETSDLNKRLSARRQPQPKACSELVVDEG
jgi:hypothetical protein